MAQPKLVKQIYTSEQLVESCGAILFDLQRQPAQVCLLYTKEKDEWLLAKGRRDAGERRSEAAVREVMEETGFSCRLLPITLYSRQPPARADPDVADTIFQHRLCEDWFATQMRRVEGSDKAKQIWWYIAVLDETASAMKAGEIAYSAQFVLFEDALRRLTFEDDRSILRQAIEIVEQHLKTMSLAKGLDDPCCERCLPRHPL